MPQGSLDSEKTAAFELGAGDDACLLIHGFTGSPWDMRPLGDVLAARGFYVKAVRLPGHGLTPAALEQVSHRDWEQAVDDALASLGNFRQVFVAGLSMGALLAVLLAARRPDRVHGLALLAPAMRFQSGPLRAFHALRRLPLLEILRPHIAKSGTDLSDADELAEAPVLPSFPSARFHDLWRIQDAARAELPNVRAPTLIVIARNDHVVDAAGARELARGLTHAPAVRFIELKEGFHILPRDKGREVLSAEVASFFHRFRE